MDKNPKILEEPEHEISLISRYEMLLMLENWLEWQKNCGTLYGRIDDPSLLQMQLPKPKSISPSITTELSNSISKSHISQLKKSDKVYAQEPHVSKELISTDSHNSETVSSKTSTVHRVTSQQRSKLKETSLNGSWSQVSKIKNYIDFHQYSPSSTSLQEVDQWVQSNCTESKRTSSQKTNQSVFECVPTRGNWNADVLLIEGHSRSLSAEGLEMLKNMREKVLLINANQFFWLPFPRGKGCGGCKAVFKAKLNSVQPKIVLWMGTELSQYLNFEGRVPELGESGVLKMVHGNIPMFRSYHPMTLLEDPSKKRVALEQLQQFHQLLLQRQIVPRENLPRYQKNTKK